MITGVDIVILHFSSDIMTLSPATSAVIASAILNLGTIAGTTSTGIITDIVEADVFDLTTHSEPGGGLS